MPRWSGAAATGSREYTETDKARVLRELRSGTFTGSGNHTNTESFALHVGLPGRTLRAILSDIDGVDVLLAITPPGKGGEGGFFVAEYADEADAWTRVLKARARKELNRAERREQFAETLPRMQAGLFSDRG